jgi:hypothetical protein
MRQFSLILALGVAFPALSVAQSTCNPPKDSHEADLFAHQSVPLAFSIGRGPTLPRPGTITVSLEGTYLPDIDATTATPTFCRPGKGPENVNILFGFVRPRVEFALAHGGFVEVSWDPPIRVKGVKPNLWGFALGRSVPIGASTLFTGRLHALIGSVHGPFTCPESYLNDPASTCNGGSVSDDRYSPNIFGAELGLGWALSGGRFRPYIGAGYNILHPRFQVNHTDQTGTLDNQKIEVNLTRLALMGGATLALSPSFGISGEVYSQPSDAVTGRVRLSYQFGKYAH